MVSAVNTIANGVTVRTQGVQDLLNQIRSRVRVNQVVPFMPASPFRERMALCFVHPSCVLEERRTLVSEETLPISTSNWYITVLCAPHDSVVYTKHASISTQDWKRLKKGSVGPFGLDWGRLLAILGSGPATSRKTGSTRVGRGQFWSHWAQPRDAAGCSLASQDIPGRRGMP